MLCMYGYSISSIHFISNTILTTILLYIVICAHIHYYCFLQQKKLKLTLKNVLFYLYMYYPAVFDLIAEVCSASFGLAETA